MKFRTPTWRSRRTVLGAGLCVLSLSACSQVETSNVDVSPAARETALARTQQVVAADEVMRSARMVEDLTGGFAQGMAGEEFGLDVELGAELGTGNTSPDATLGSVVVRAHRDLQGARAQLARWQIAQAGKEDPQPGDLLYRDTQTNADGSVTVTSIYQDAPLAVVRVVQQTTWPNGNLLLSAIENEIFVDRGPDFEIEDDDIWLSLASELRFVGGQRLHRSVDAGDQGGFRDDLRVDVVSTFTPRPHHPRLVDVVSTLTIDLHQLDLETDDRFVRVDRVTRFNGTAHDGGSPRVVEAIAPESPVAESEEPCGGEASREIYFATRSAITDLRDAASWSCAGGGSLSRTVNYDDGTQDSLTLSEDAEGVVTLDLRERTGAVTTGTFDETAGTFSIATDYPAGSDPVARAISGQSNPEGTDWSLDETVTYADGFEEQNHLEGMETDAGKSLSGSHAGRDETFEFSLATNADDTVLEGHIENDRGESLDFRAEQLADGGRLLDFTAINPTTRVEGHIEVGADGCGTIDLVITEGDARTEIHSEFCEGDLDEDDFLADN